MISVMKIRNESKRSFLNHLKNQILFQTRKLSTMRLLVSILSSLGAASTSYQNANGLPVLDLRSEETKLRDASREKREILLDNPDPIQGGYPKLVPSNLYR